MYSDSVFRFFPVGFVALKIGEVLSSLPRKARRRLSLAGRCLIKGPIQENLVQLKIGKRKSRKARLGVCQKEAEPPREPAGASVILGVDA